MSKPEHERPEGCRFWVWQDVRDWIEANALDRLDTRDGKSVEERTEEATMWWLACRHAQAYCDNTFREVAEMLRDGIPALDRIDVTNELQLPYEDEHPNTEEIDATWERMLRQHFDMDDEMQLGGW